MIQKALALAEELQGKIEANISNLKKNFTQKCKNFLIIPKIKLCL